MRYLKGSAAAAMAAASLLGLLGVASASAAELYSTGVTAKAGTSVDASLELGTTLTWTYTDGRVFQTCSQATFEGDIDSYNGGDVTEGLDHLSSSGCSHTTDTLTNGSISISASGTVSGKGSVVTANTGVTCRYGTGSGTTLGTLTTGKISIKAVINEQEPKAFLCVDTIIWEGDFVVTNPHDLAIA
jgi:hypothetical protein